MAPAIGPAQGGNEVVLDGANLGCVVAVAFGKVVTFETTNSQALLACGTTNQVIVAAPPGKSGESVPVSVATVESASTRRAPRAIPPLTPTRERPQLADRSQGDDQARFSRRQVGRAGK